MDYAKRIAIVVVVLAALAFPWFLSSRITQERPPVPDFGKDLIGKTVLLSQWQNDGAWTFSSKDDIQAVYVDGQHDVKTSVYYVDIYAVGEEGDKLAGIAELHYLKLGGTMYLVGIGNISLQLTQPPAAPEKHKEAKPAAPAKVTPAQRPPKG